ncbi:14099_t:CDS:2, partial [Gigaspora rosea]
IDNVQINSSEEEIFDPINLRKDVEVVDLKEIWTVQLLVILQTGNFLAKEIDNVLNEIGVEKFAAVVTDHGSNQSEEFSNSFNPISGSCNTNMQLDDIDETNLLIEEIIDLSNPAFVGNNNSFFENQNIVINHNTQ